MTTPTTPNDLAAIEQRANAATEGPWVAHPDGLVWADRPGDPVSGSTEIEDAEFIAAARTDVPSLAAEVKQLRDELDLSREFHKLAVSERDYELARVDRLTGERDEARVEIKRLDASQDDALRERDEYHEVADQLAEAIAAITGTEIGEHSSGNDPWGNALHAARVRAEELKRDRAEVKRLRSGVEDTVAALRAAAMAEDGQPAYSFAAGLNDGLQLATARLRALLDGAR